MLLCAKAFEKKTVSKNDSYFNLTTDVFRETRRTVHAELKTVSDYEK